MTNKRILTLITLLLFLLLVVGCDWITPNQPPVITSDPVEMATVGVDYTYNVVATDPNAGDVLTYSLTTEPLGMLINATSGVITWKADDITAAGIGDYDVVVVVSDEDGLSDTQDFTITVSEFVVELVGIEVDPEEMTLYLIEGTVPGSFKVTADYDDGSTADVTSECVYGISNISIATVEAGKVTAGEVGTATISINYTEGDITKGTILTVIVEGTITIRWLEDAVRYFSDGKIQEWFNCPIPSEVLHVPFKSPATLIPFYGGYHFADIAFFWNYYPLPGLDGNIVISEAGLMSGCLTYISPGSGLPIKDYIEGEVDIIIGEITNWGEVIPEVSIPPEDYDGVMVGTYTQWSYAYASGENILTLNEKYPGAVYAPEIGLDWWFIGHTDYIAHQ